jgi:flagellar hook assembly protein FlgD
VALGAWPNPFNPSTTVKFSIPTAGPVSLNVYDLQGRLVKTLAHGHFAGGDHARVWDGTTNSGSRAASGSYVVRMTAGPHQAVTKLSLVK